ncbi:HNH endonuclease [Streptococcus oralis]|uniref:HNH endonuclease n=1 Tax=Streptococcus oralis TaxID=1303 RepID=UPI0009B92E70|nr:HNH endonuclease [Streptococcus oralis]
MTRCKKTAKDKYCAKAPPGFVWHHDTGGMTRLLPKDIHKSVKHTGSVAQHQTRKGKGKC